MPTRLKQWDRGAGFAAIRTDWLARAAHRGKTIRVKLADGERSGQFEMHRSDRPVLLLKRLADGTSQTITAGDVAFAVRS